MDAKEIDALISLIDDPDELVYSHVREKILSMGAGVIPQLENRWELNSFGHVFQQRIEDLIHDIQFGSVHGALREWSAQGAADLLEGVLLVARYQYPDLNEQEVRDQLARIRQEIWLELNEELTALEKVKILNHFLFDVHNFRGNKKNFHAAQNSYINAVLETRKGNPLSLSIVYIVLAEQLDIPVYGVNLPNHFLLAYVDPFSILRFAESGGDPDAEWSDVLFYINAFSRGTIVHRSEVLHYLEEIKAEPLPAYYQPCDNRTIVTRLINNLIFSYDRLGYPEKVEELRRLHAALRDD